MNDSVGQQRSMLIILIAACEAAQTAFEAADNELDVELRADLARMIDRSKSELERLSGRLADRPAGEAPADPPGISPKG